MNGHYEAKMCHPKLQWQLFFATNVSSQMKLKKVFSFECVSAEGNVKRKPSQSKISISKEKF